MASHATGISDFVVMLRCVMCDEVHTVGALCNNYEKQMCDACYAKTRAAEPLGSSPSAVVSHKTWMCGCGLSMCQVQLNGIQ